MMQSMVRPSALPAGYRALMRPSRSVNRVLATLVKTIHRNTGCLHPRPVALRKDARHRVFELLPQSRQVLYAVVYHLLAESIRAVLRVNGSLEDLFAGLRQRQEERQYVVDDLFGLFEEEFALSVTGIGTFLASPSIYFEILLIKRLA